MSSEESIILTLNWYDKFYKKNNEDKITISQIEEYEKKIKNKKIKINKLNKIKLKKGNIIKFLKSNSNNYKGFGEIYFQR